MVGICEAALVTAGQLAKRIAIVTTLPRSIVPLKSFSAATVSADRALVTACATSRCSTSKRAVRRGGEARCRDCAGAGQGAEAIVLGCAGMADLALTLSTKFDVPVIDGVAAAVKQAEALVGLKLTTSRRGSYAFPAAKSYAGMLEPFAPR